MLSFLSLAAAAASVSLLPLSQAASSCVVFDANWNLYVFGGTDDVNLGTTLGSPSATTLPTSGRPDYGTSTLSCFLSQYNNAIYLLGASSSSPSSVYIFNPSSSSWSTQSTSGTQPSLENSATILDHDTNVFFTISGGTEVSQLDFGNVKTAGTSDAAAWDAVSSTPWTDTSYNPTIAVASNHILAIGAPDVAAGSADIFTIHYAVWQNDSQTFPTTDSGSSFPPSHGQATSFFQSTEGGAVQYQVAFVPDDFSSTYLLTHWTSPSTAGSTDGAPDGISSYLNTTQILPAPTSKDTSSSYAASDVNLVQLTSSGELYYLDALTSSTAWAVKSGASWTKMDYTMSGASSGSSNSSNSSSSSASASASASGSGMASATKSAASTSAAAASSSSAAAKASASASGTSAGSREVQGMGALVGSLVLGAGALFLL